MMSSTPVHTNDAIDAADVAESSRLMAELSIAHDGRYFHYDGYRYERLADAVSYAQLVRARQSQRRTESLTFVPPGVVEAPNAAAWQLMLELSISFENGRFVFEGFRYDSLIDAANYARHRRQLDIKTPSRLDPEQ